MNRMQRAGSALAILCAIGTCSFFFFNSSPKSLEPLSARNLLHAFPDTPAKVDAYTEETISLFNAEISKFLSIGVSDRTFANTVEHWDQIGKMLVHRMIVLKSLSILNVSEETLSAADKAFDRVQQYLTDKVSASPQIPLAIISYLENAPKSQTLSPAEWLYVYQLSESLNSNWFPLFYQRKIDAMKQTISTIPRLNYSHKMGDAPVKELRNESPSFSLLNFNACFLPGNLPLLFGGMTPWSLRIDKVANRILQLDADVICLQEVFEEESADILYEKLKGKYAYFYMNIGPRNFGFNHESAGMGSGLFIASKLKIESPQFHLFKNTSYHMNRGCFDFTVVSSGTPFAHIYTTHLEAFSHPPAPELRKEQLEQILDQMNQDSKKTEDSPAIILCGDLNIPWSSKEPAEMVLQEYFSDAYNKSHKELSMKTRTYVDFTELWWKAKLDTSRFTPKPEILDYAILLQKLPGSQEPYAKEQNYRIVTAVIPMNELDNPLDALSDHHAEMSLIQKR